MNYKILIAFQNSLFFIATFIAVQAKINDEYDDIIRVYRLGIF